MVRFITPLVLLFWISDYRGRPAAAPAQPMLPPQPKVVGPGHLQNALLVSPCIATMGEHWADLKELPLGPTTAYGRISRLHGDNGLREAAAAGLQRPQSPTCSRATRSITSTSASNGTATRVSPFRITTFTHTTCRPQCRPRSSSGMAFPIRQRNRTYSPKAASLSAAVRLPGEFPLHRPRRNVWLRVLERRAADVCSAGYRAGRRRNSFRLDSAEYYGTTVKGDKLPNRQDKGPVCKVGGVTHVNGIAVDGSGVLYVPDRQDPQDQDLRAALRQTGCRALLH